MILSFPDCSDIGKQHATPKITYEIPTRQIRWVGILQDKNDLVCFFPGRWQQKAPVWKTTMTQQTISGIIFKRTLSEGFPGRIWDILYESLILISHKFTADIGEAQAHYDAIDKKS